jgi:hypothetical protein
MHHAVADTVYYMHLRQLPGGWGELITGRYQPSHVKPQPRTRHCQLQMPIETKTAPDTAVIGTLFARTEAAVLESCYLLEAHNRVHGKLRRTRRDRSIRLRVYSPLFFVVSQLESWNLSWVSRRSDELSGHIILSLSPALVLSTSPKKLDDRLDGAFEVLPSIRIPYIEDTRSEFLTTSPGASG